MPKIRGPLAKKGVGWLGAIVEVQLHSLTLLNKPLRTSCGVEKERET